MGQTNIARVDALRSKGFASITGSYTVLGSVFAHRMRLLHFINNTDGDLLISFDGTTDNIFIPAGSFSLYDVTTNTDTAQNPAFVFSIRTQVYVKQSTAPTSGAIYLVAFYGQGE